MMKKFLGPSWKPRVAAILTLFLPPGLWFILTGPLKFSDNTATEVSGAFLGLLASVGLFNAKQVNVSNAPQPLIEAQPIVVNPKVS